MRFGVMVIVAAACGGSPAPTPVATTTTRAPAPPTCADVGVILRGDVTADDDNAGPAREHAIQSACEGDRWAPDVIRCAASTAHPADCLDKLSDAQRTTYTARLQAWSTEYGVPAADAPAAEPLSCEEGLHNSDAIRPALDDSSPERTWQSELRHHELVEMCLRAGWNPKTRECFAIATTPDAADTCLTAELDPAARDALAKRLDRVAAVAAQIATLKKTPAKVDCNHVVEAHYADAKWPGNGTTAQRKQSRSQMMTACTTEQWDDFRRACMIVDQRFCPRDLRWEYPALTTACGEYASAIDHLDSCDAIPLTTREALKQSFQAARLGWSNQPDSVEAACRAGANAVIAVLQSARC